MVYDGSVSRTDSYTYASDWGNNIEQIVTGSDSDITITPEWDINNRYNGSVSQIADVTLTESITYYKQGDHGTNLSKVYSYVVKKGGAVKSSGQMSVTYDASENISGITVNGAGITYTYDSLGRLEKEVNEQLGQTYIFTYDNNGNILTKKVGNTTINYAYDGDKLVSYNGQACVYDALGNPTIYRSKTATWVRGKRLISYNGNTFTYDATGRRLSKNGLKFYYDSNGRLLKQSNGLEFYYDVIGIAAIKYNGAMYLCRKDLQGNIIALIDNSGTTVVQYNYDAWGNHKVVDANGNEITDPNHLGNLNPFRYRGYYYDTETGFYFLKTRYYDPEVGRFLNMDSVRYADLKSVNGINLYAYCMNNPIKNTDPDGTFILGWIIAAVVAVCVVQTISDVVEVVEISKNENERIEVSEDGTNVKIVDSHKIKTPWMQLGYSIYLNHFKEETKDVIQGSSFGVQFEWQAHNLMYTIGKIVDNETIMNSAKSVDVGKTIFDDNHAEGFAGFASSAMKVLYALTTNPIYSIYDLIVYNRR